MARMIGYVQGHRGSTSRLGSADSGIEARAQGWRVGVTVYGKALDDGTDEFHVYATSGSGGGHVSRLVGVVSLDESGRPAFTPEEQIICDNCGCHAIDFDRRHAEEANH